MAKVTIAAAAVVVVALAAALYQRLRPLPALSVQPAVPTGVTVPGPAPTMPWPPTGEAAVDVPSVGMLMGPGSDRPVPITSLAKIMLAYVVLHDRPLAPGTGGPGLTVTAADAAAYRAEVGQQQGLVKITAGEVLTERQVLEGLLVASGNDLAGLVARWDRGSDAGLLAGMNAAAGQLGLTHTHYNDTVGLDPATVSTPAEQLHLTEAAMADPTFASIVAEPRVQLPQAGALANFNSLLGQDGVVGVKSGSSNAAGGCLSVAAQRTVGGNAELVYAVVLGQGGATPIQQALLAGKALVDAAGSAVKTATVVPAGTPVAAVHVPWGLPMTAVTAAAVELPGWGGLPAMLGFQPARLGRTSPADGRVGDLIVTVSRAQQHVPVRLTRRVSPPSLTWRLRRVP